MLKIVTGLALIILALGCLACLYVIIGFPVSPTVPSLSLPDASAYLRINRLQEEIETLKTLQAAKPAASDAKLEGFSEGIRQHQQLLDETRNELRIVQERLKESNDALKTANETEKRVRESATAFLTLFAIIAAGLVGQAYFQIQGWDDRAKKALDEIQAVKPDLESIRDARKSLDDELPAFLSEAQQKLLVFEDPGATIQQQNVALIDEIDHFTYLSTYKRFQKVREKPQAREYMRGVLFAARGQIARRAYWEALSRLDEFFKTLVLFPEAVTAEDKARAYSYRALVVYQLMRQPLAVRSWARESRAPEMGDRLEMAWSDIRLSQECDPAWDHAYFVEALLSSYFYVPETVTDPARRAAMYTSGQKKSVFLYEKLIAGGARQYRACHQNLACCMKRIFQKTGDPEDYRAFKQRLSTFPSDLDLFNRFVPKDKRSEVHFLWQSMMSDPELFAEIAPSDPIDYRNFWEKTLNDKVVLRSWRDDLKELREASPDMRIKWQVQLV